MEYEIYIYIFKLYAQKNYEKKMCRQIQYKQQHSTAKTEIIMQKDEKRKKKKGKHFRFTQAEKTM